MNETQRDLRIANCSGFYGDRLSAAREMVEGGPIDVLTGDYLAELTMMILWKTQQRDGQGGYARTFLQQMEQVLGTCVDRGIKVVANAGGLNPRGLVDHLRELAGRLGVDAKIAYIEGDDIRDRLDELQAKGYELTNLDTGEPLAKAGVQPVTANVYLGAWGIVEALASGADVVVTPRVTDASVVVGPAAWHFGWSREDWDRLAGAVVAGHILECGAQTTGGNFSFFTELPDHRLPGFPIAEMADDGSCVITKHPGTGGLVSVDTVTAQLLYELGPPGYANPDVVARFDIMRLDQEGPDRVRVSGVRGEPAPRDLKVCLNYSGGYRNSVTFMLTGLNIEAKAERATRQLFDLVGGRENFESVDVQLIRTDVEDAEANEGATARLQVTVKDQDPGRVGRRFSNAATSLGLSGYPGFYTATPPQKESAFGVYWPTLVPAAEVPHYVVTDDGRRIDVPHTTNGGPGAPVPDPAPGRPAGTWGSETRRVPLGTLFGARSGDKGGNANVGLWARDDGAYAWLAGWFTVDQLKRLLPEARSLRVDRYELPNLRALNFVVHGLLGEGVASSVREDAQAKSLGEFLRARLADVPVDLLDRGSGKHGARTG
ncbi:MAG: acyclic terpene utilization AtuA family protein [Streptosporangiales bacterium]|nr:acyclic terpene utilization AtuA family protein [Streptosporangiales bacterium]